jgi:hypothetical protein
MQGRILSTKRARDHSSSSAEQSAGSSSTLSASAGFGNDDLLPDSSGGASNWGSWSRTRFCVPAAVDSGRFPRGRMAPLYAAATTLLMTMPTLFHQLTIPFHLRLFRRDFRFLAPSFPFRLVFRSSGSTSYPASLRAMLKVVRATSTLTLSDRRGLETAAVLSAP